MVGDLLGWWKTILWVSKRRRLSTSYNVHSWVAQIYSGDGWSYSESTGSVNRVDLTPFIPEWSKLTRAMERKLSPLLVSCASGSQPPDPFFLMAQIITGGTLSPACCAPLSTDQSSYHPIVHMPTWINDLNHFKPCTGSPLSDLHDLHPIAQEACANKTPFFFRGGWRQWCRSYATRSLPLQNQGDGGPPPNFSITSPSTAFTPLRRLALRARLAINAK